MIHVEFISELHARYVAEYGPEPDSEETSRGPWAARRERRDPEQLRAAGDRARAILERMRDPRPRA
jgi:hypothetical protein